MSGSLFFVRRFDRRCVVHSMCVCVCVGFLLLSLSFIAAFLLTRICTLRKLWIDSRHTTLLMYTTENTVNICYKSMCHLNMRVSGVCMRKQLFAIFIFVHPVSGSSRFGLFFQQQLMDVRISCCPFKTVILSMNVPIHKWPVQWNFGVRWMISKYLLEIWMNKYK